MKTLLVGINASYSHTCLAVRSICAYVKDKIKLATGDDKAADSIDFKEFTINQPYGEIIRGIAQSNADTVLFSTYIWNAELTCKLIPDVKKVLPGAVIGAGGPEFGYAAEKYLNLLPDLDFIVFGEGERGIINYQLSMGIINNEELIINNGRCEGGFRNIKGVFYRGDEGIVYSGDEELICDLSELSFPYPELLNHQKTDGASPGDNTSSPNPLLIINYSLLINKIFYYESSRGCPYSCAYCLSSVDKRVRFMPLERVYKDLQIFLDAQVPLVKFVDRTYNLQQERYIAIWEYILEHHNGKTMFHFEIEAEYLSEQALDFLQKVPAGVMQFEIGVQSANRETLRAVNRSDNIEKLAANIRRIPRTIHQHLDLIAGLPFEDLESFGRSFDFVMALAPDALQLGFLKVLHGTPMEKYAAANNWKWMQTPAYETFSTPYMSYDDMLFLKDVEVLVDAYWNSGVFANTMKYIGRTVGFWKFFCSMTEFCRASGAFEQPRRESYWFEILAKYSANHTSYIVHHTLLKYDFILRGKQGNFPEWYVRNYNKDRHWELLEQSGGVKNPRLDFAHSEYEVFDFDVDAEEPEKCPGQFEKLLKY